MNKKISVRQIVLAALLTAITAVLSQIALPLPFAEVPLTMQVFAVALCGFVAGPVTGLCAIGAYLLLGAVGAPVFTGFQGGILSLFGLTGGFLWGFLPMVFLCGLARRRFLLPKASPAKKAAGVGLCAAGLAVCHLLGAAQYALLSGVGLGPALLAVSAPFLVKDAASVFCAFAAATVLGRVPALRKL